MLPQHGYACTKEALDAPTAWVCMHPGNFLHSVVPTSLGFEMLFQAQSPSHYPKLNDTFINEI